MSTNGILDFQNTNKIIFRGSDSNVVIDTSNVSLGIGIQGTETPGSNLHVVGNAFISSNLKLTTDTSILVNSNVVAEYTGPHSRDPKAVPLKKYPEIVFDASKMDGNDTTNTYTQAGYTVTASSQYIGNGTIYRVWKIFDEKLGGSPAGETWIQGDLSAYDINGDYVLSPANNLGTGADDGEWVKLELPNKITLERIHITPRDSNREPEDFKIYGSIDNVNWVEILSETGASPAITTGTSYMVDVRTTSYKYLGMVIKKIVGSGYFAIDNLELYGYEEDPPTGDTSVDTTFTSIMNTPQTTGANVYTDAKLSSDFTNQVTGPTPVGTAAVHDNTNKYWEMNGQLTSNITVEANTFLEGDQPHAVSVWFNSSNLEANVSNTCVFSVSDQEKLDSVNLDLQSNTWHNLTYAYQGEGGSRVTYLDGRKVAEDQAEDTFGEYPPFAMTGYSQGGYVVSASSDYLSDVNALRNAYKVYNATTGTAGVWMTEFGTFNPNAVGGNTFTDSYGGTHTGHWNKLELPYKLKPSYFYFKNSGTYTGSRNATNWVILGSNNDSEWDLLHSSTTVLNATKSIPITATKGYTYLMFLCKSVNADTALYMDEIRYYGHRENDLVRLPDPTNVLKYPHIAMTGPAQRGYVASASTTYSTHDVSKAFNGVPNDFFHWEVASFANSDGSYSAGTQSFESISGEWLKIQLPNKIKPTSTNLYRRGFDGQSPKDFKIYASITGSSWTLLTEQTGVDDWTNAAKSYSFTTNIYYKYFVILVTKITRTNISGAQTSGTIGELEIYGTEENSSIPIQIGGGNIDKVANFRVYDKFVGEDQALEIWDAQKDEFRGVKNSVTLHKGRLGIGTDEPQGRLAVADEPRYPILEEFPPRGMSSYKNFFEGHGEFCASASHQYTTTGNGSTWKAFDKTDMYGSDDSEWQTSGGTFSSGALAGSGLTTITNGIGAGVWIQLEMPYKIILKKWAIGQRTTQQNRHIKTGFLVGTNDGRKWDIIQTITGATSQTDYHHRYYDLSTNNLYHKTIRLVITEINGGDRPDINQIKFFGTREQGQSVLHDGQLTLTKSLTVPRIGPALDADDTPRRDRLVVEYNTSTNPTFEGAVRDTSGRGNDGVFVGTATYDAMQKSLEFPSNPVAGSTSGTYDSIFAGDIFKRKITQHTTSLWLKPHSMAAWEQVFGIGQNVSVAHEGLWISGTDRLAVHTEGGNPSQQYHYTIGNVNGQWIHVTLVRNSLTFGDHILYVNGIPLTATTTAGGTDTMSIPEESDLRIGGRLMGNDSYWLDGSISNFKLYDTALTAEEVKTLYDMGRCDEGHHVVNFSKTRVGIGLGDGEAPRGALDVRGETPFIGPGLVIHQAASGNWGTEGDPANMNGLLLTLEGESGLTSGSSYWNIAAQATGSGSLLFAHRGKATAFIDVNRSGESLDFTGQHRTFIKDVPFSQAGDLEGLIVSSDQNKYIKMSGGIEAGSNAIMINESLPVVSLSNVVTDKRCFGVISASEDPEQRSDSYGSFVTPFEKEKGDTRVYINSVGEGAIWVVNTNGSLEAGDYITTSNVAGYGQKQDDDVLHNYTVAKITMDCDFEPVTQPVQQILRSNVVETYYLGNVHKVKNVPHESVTTTVTADDAWSNVSINPSDTTYAEWSNLEANTQNTYTLTYSQTSNVVYDTKYTLTTTANVTESDAWDKVFVDPPTVTYAEYSNLEANTQNTYTLTYTQTTTDEKTPDEWSTLESNVQSLYNEVYYQSVEEEVAATWPGAVAHTRVTNVIENELDVHGQIQWGDHPTETEKAYKIRYLDASGAQTDEANAVHIAAFVGCTYHCG